MGVLVLLATGFLAGAFVESKSKFIDNLLRKVGL